MKCTWFDILQNDEKAANLAYSFISPDLKHLVWACNLSSKDITELIPKERNSFWYDVLVSWSYLHFESDPDRSTHILWFNSLVRINGHTVWWPNAFRRGLVYCDQLYPNGVLIEEGLARQLYQITVMELNSLVAAVPRQWRSMAREGVVCRRNEFWEKCQKTKSLAKMCYNLLISAPSGISDRAVKWSNDLREDISDGDISRCFVNINKCTNIPKYRSFQYRLLHRAIILNSHLYRWGMCENNRCSFCGEEKETSVHLFCDCRYTRFLWDKVEEYMRPYVRSGHYLTVSNIAIIFNSFTKPPTHVCNLLGLATKQYIYRQRCLKGELVFSHLKCIFSRLESIEKYIAQKNLKLSKHNAKWGKEDTSSVVETHVI